MTLISSQTLGGTTASVTFSSIPTSYNDLKLVVSARGDTAAVEVQIAIKLNGDSGTNYSTTGFDGNSNTVSSYRGSNATSINFFQDASTATASVFGYTEIYFPNYNSTGSKPFYIADLSENNSALASNQFIDTSANLYRGASGITSITLTPASGNFVQYSNFYLYGIKNS